MLDKIETFVYIRIGVSRDLCYERGENVLKSNPRSESHKQAARENLPDAELEVLGCLWQRGKSTARGLRETMASYRPMAHGSMVTLLKRLEKKGFVSKRKGAVGKAFVYEPTHGPKKTYRRIMEYLYLRVFGGSGVAMVTSLFESRPPTREEIKELQKLLDQLQQRYGD